MKKFGVHLFLKCKKKRIRIKFILVILLQKLIRRSYIYNLRTKEKKFVKEQEVLDKNYSPKNYITERLECKSHDGRLIPLTITRHKDTKIDGTANVLLYGYGSYGNS